MNISKEQGLLIRAIAIMMIVLYHFQYDMFGGILLVERGEGFISWISHSGTAVFLSICFIGVNVFFVLSGYGLMKKYKEKKHVKMMDMGKQTLKILIPYWIAHPLVHVIDWSLKNLQYHFGFIGYKTYFLGMHSFNQYIDSFFVFPRWFSNDGALAFVGTWWFVGVIIQFYLLFPFILKIFKKFKPINALLLCIGVSFLYRFIISVNTSASPIGVNEANIWLFVNFPARLSEFALGMYLASEVKFVNFKSKSLYGVLLILLGFVSLGNIYTMFVSDFLFALGAIILVYSITKSLKGHLEKVFSIIGRKSYLIYLYHEPTLKLLLKFIFPNLINS
ncbi:acyltransferase [bacterium]|nr:acyltransferase [bacterium]